MASSVPFTGLFIDGQLRPASDKGFYEVHNPYTRQVVGHAAAATQKDCRDAVEVAARAFKTWENSPYSTRRDIFLKASELLSTDKWKKRATEALQEEVSATDFMIIFNFFLSTNGLRVDAGAIDQLKGESFASILPGGQVSTQRRAMGVIYAISPWNVPLALTIRAFAVPIICGNTVVLKTSESSPRSQTLLAELLHEAGLPNGVLNIISTRRVDSPPRSAEIIAHPAVRKINFTGSSVVAKLLAAEAAKWLKPCVFELGGKAPVVVLEDADIDRAARAITSSALMNSGQICMSTERVIVMRKVAPALTDALKKHFSSLKAGGPGSPLSALFTEASAQRFMGLLDDALKSGAKLLHGDNAREGSVIQPHIVTDVTSDMRIWNEESFAPNVIVHAVDTVDEAIEYANKSDYSLMAAVWTKDVYNAYETAGRIHSGTVNINGPTIHTEMGFAGSGVGSLRGLG
ncbi:aldehyde dehydrogenase [Fomitopsis serialis]|uniref:aldehyde dehydrogenase n=1 Tax=Fomitopsis serialis TaxID=139415 RepID=UPI002008B943|nr:aldehyde dehydrogenase [Neoantrodia serialis]KAH9929273.1 aldehyde dehydrogenase [Neoantrodia serialis]